MTQAPGDVDRRPVSRLLGEAEARLSVIVPLLNEEGSIGPLHEALSASLRGIGQPYEIIFVDDGSTDRGPAILAALALADPAVAVVSLRRNFGKAAALDAGFRSASGDILITMDADLQDDPKEIPRFLAKLAEGYDLVTGWKKVRHDPLSKTLPSRVFNGVVSAVSGLKLHDFNCGFKAYRAELADALSLYGDMHRFIPVLAHWYGFRVAEIPVEHHPRQFGASKYGVGRFFKGFFDLLTVMLIARFRSRPLHFFGYMALLIGALGAIGLGYLFVESILGTDSMRPRPLLYVSIILIVAAVQLLSTGLLGELIKSLHETRRTDYHERRAPARPDADRRS